MASSARIARIAFIATAVLAALIIFKVWTSRNHFNSELFEPANILTHISELSSPTYAGKPAGSKENEKTLEYIVNHFRRFGVHGN